MVFKPTILLVIFIALLSGVIGGYSGGYHNHDDDDDNYNSNSSSSYLPGIEMPEHPSFNAVSSSDCTLASPSPKNPEATLQLAVDRDGDGDANRFKESLKLHLRHRSPPNQEKEAKHTVIESTARDLIRIQTLHRRITEKKNQNAASRQAGDRRKPAAAEAPESAFSGRLMATLGSGVSLGSGEYFMDVFVGTPSKHFSLILDTGSDLNWIQCVPCRDCFEQSGPHYDPAESSSYRSIGCRDPRCGLVSSPEPPRACAADNQSCPYYYWYGDSSNTTGDFALETFTVNLTGPGSPELRRVENVMFGCGHWNRGLFHGAAGLLGLGRGPLSFASQLQSLYGHSFSYCLVDRDSNADVRSKLIFGEDKDLLAHPELNFTALVAGKENPVDTFYYVGIESISVGGQRLDIPAETWNLRTEGGGGTIVDSGTTLSYFAEPAYEMIREAFVKKVKGYAMVEDFPVLSPCYNVSGVEKLELPEFGIRFLDGAVWNFPVENYFIRLPPEEIVCLAILNTTRSSLSIIGNYQQQNFHILYDTKRSRLGFAPANCARL